MILDELKTANDAILGSVNAAKDRQAAKAFKAQMGNLDLVTKELEQLLHLITALSEKEFIRGVVTEDIRHTLQDAVDNCGCKVNEHALDAATVRLLKAAVELCRNSAGSKWKAVAEERSNAVIEPLELLKKLLGNTKEAENILEYLKKARVTMPGSEKELDIFTEKLDRGKKIVDNLHFTSDKEIGTFLENVRVGRATIEDVTPKVLDWLRDNHLTGKIKLSFRTA